MIFVNYQDGIQRPSVVCMNAPRSVHVVGNAAGGEVAQRPRTKKTGNKRASGHINVSHPQRTGWQHLKKFLLGYLVRPNFKVNGRKLIPYNMTLLKFMVSSLYCT